MFAPIVIFCYTRLDLLKKTVSALLKNKEAAESEVFFYSDGGKDELTWKQVNKVRKYLSTLRGFGKVTIVEQKENVRLNANLIQGITEVVNKFGKVIVVEDDIVVSRYFLSYMNRALDHYQDRKEVMTIAGFNPCKYPKDFPETFCMRLAMVWGWGPWNDRWEKYRYFDRKEIALFLLTPEDKKNIEFGGAWRVLDHLNLSPISWDTCLYISLYLEKSVSVFPVKSLTRHIGKNGIHYTSSFWGRLLHHVPFDNIESWQGKENITLTDITERNLAAEEIFRDYWRYFEYNTLLLRIIQKILQLGGINFYTWVRKSYQKLLKIEEADNNEK